MSENTLLLTVIGTGIGMTAVIVSVVLVGANEINRRMSALGGQSSTRSAKRDRIDPLNDRIDKTNDRIDALRREVREDHAALDARLRDVQVEFAKVDQRLATVERVVLPQPPPAA